MKDPKASNPSCLLIHANVYVHVDKYFVNNLKDLIIEKYNAATKQHQGRNDFIEAAREAYTNTLETNRGLKDAVVEAIYEHSDILKLEVQQVIRDLHILSYDLLMYIHQEKDHFEYPSLTKSNLNSRPHNTVRP